MWMHWVGGCIGSLDGIDGWCGLGGVAVDGWVILGWVGSRVVGRLVGGWGYGWVC